MTKIKLDDYIKKDFCFYCAEKPSQSCFKKHYSFIENMDEYCDNLGVYEQ